MELIVRTTIGVTGHSSTENAHYASETKRGLLRDVGKNGFLYFARSQTKRIVFPDCFHDA
jgi:hypothetical protein